MYDYTTSSMEGDPIGLGVCLLLFFEEAQWQPPTSGVCDGVSERGRGNWF